MQILIDDIPIKDYDIHYLRSRIVMVDQHTVLFNTTIRENIAYGLDVTDEEIIQALKDAKIWDFVEKEPDQLLSVLQVPIARRTHALSLCVEAQTLL